MFTDALKFRAIRALVLVSIGIVLSCVGLTNLLESRPQKESEHKARIKQASKRVALLHKVRNRHAQLSPDSREEIPSGLDLEVSNLLSNISGERAKAMSELLDSARTSKLEILRKIEPSDIEALVDEITKQLSRDELANLLEKHLKLPRDIFYRHPSSK